MGSPTTAAPRAAAPQAQRQHSLIEQFLSNPEKFNSPEAKQALGAEMAKFQPMIMLSQCAPKDKIEAVGALSEFNALLSSSATQFRSGNPSHQTGVKALTELRDVLDGLPKNLPGVPEGTLFPRGAKPAEALQGWLDALKPSGEKAIMLELGGAAGGKEGAAAAMRRAMEGMRDSLMKMVPPPKDSKH